MKKYRLADGRKVRVVCTDRRDNNFPLVVLVGNKDKEMVVTCTADGFYRISKVDHPLNLIEVTEWDDFKVDEPVMVRSNESADWLKRYFAGISSEGLPMAWNEGCTSWSAKGKTACGYCRRPTKAELDTEWRAK